MLERASLRVSQGVTIRLGADFVESGEEAPITRGKTYRGILSLYALCRPIRKYKISRSLEYPLPARAEISRSTGLYTNVRLSSGICMSIHCVSSSYVPYVILYDPPNGVLDVSKRRRYARYCSPRGLLFQKCKETCMKDVESTICVSFFDNA